MRTIACVLLACLLAFAAQRPKPKPAPDSRPDINSARQVELEKLPGINRLLAKKIIANRPYESVDDLKRAGVPAATVARLKPLVRCETEPHSSPPPAARKKRAAGH